MLNEGRGGVIQPRIRFFLSFYLKLSFRELLNCQKMSKSSSHLIGLCHSDNVVTPHSSLIKQITKCGFSQFPPELVFTAAATTIKTVRRLKTTENKLLITRHYIYANCKYKFRCVLNFNLFALLFNRRYLKIIRMGIFRCIVGSDE